MRRKSTYLYERTDWPHFVWSRPELEPLLAAVRFRMGFMNGRLESLGLAGWTVLELSNLTEDVVKSGEIEGEFLHPEQVRSSLARRLGLDAAGLPPVDRAADGFVAMLLDATGTANETLTSEDLFRWHQLLFAGVAPGPYSPKIGIWREDVKGPMQELTFGS